MSNKILVSLLSLGLMGFSIQASIASTQEDPFQRKFYMGVSAGYGSTTWGYLVPRMPSLAMSMSTPINVSEGGLIGGVFGGYEIVPQFAVEASYTHYPTARIYYDPSSLFSLDFNDSTRLLTDTEAYALMGKVMIIIPRTSIRGFSSFGAAVEHRSDIVKNIWRLEPTFGAGFNYNITSHWMTEVGINYIAGYGESEIDPTRDFVPFLYSAFLRVAYRF